MAGPPPSDWHAAIAVARDCVPSRPRARAPVAVVAPRAESQPECSWLTARAALEGAPRLAPRPGRPDRAACCGRCKHILGAEPAAELVWLSDGIAGEARTARGLRKRRIGERLR